MVELIYAPLGLPIVHLHLTVSEGASIRDVISQSGLLMTHPEIKDLAVGVFSKQMDLDTKVKKGWRIEIYRPLLIDPMEKRRRLASEV